MKPVAFLGDSIARIKEFPPTVRNEVGHQIYRVQIGLEPTDWKPLKTVGRGIREIRMRHERGAYRVIYVGTMANAVYVLHAFQKKSQGTPKRELELAAKRFAEIAGS